MTPVEDELASRLRRMQWLATGLMALMAGVFVATSFWRSSLPALGYVWAFAEAALIGGLADWFAVTALFRHPLGIPIPHTAIVPRRKNDIGRALAHFVAEHFLVRDVIAARLTGAGLSARLGEWMRTQEHARRLGRDIATALGWLCRGADGHGLTEAMQPTLRRMLDGLPPHRIGETLLDVLTAGNHAQLIFSQLVSYAREQLERNRSRIRERIRDRSPWWLPKFVDEEIYDQLVGELERILNEIGTDPDHRARVGMQDRLREFREALGNDPVLIARAESLRDELFSHPEVGRFIDELWQRTQDSLERALDDPHSELRQALEAEIVRLGSELRFGSPLAERVDRWLTEVIVYLIEHYRDPISRIISETIAQWDPDSTASRIELHIGRDLQFIRINGTLVGGLVGLLLYTGWTALGL
jgi:uncharacterized membrane-anchored protein YjiN (DUF445 family)